MLTSSRKPDDSRDLLASDHIRAIVAYCYFKYTPWDADAGASRDLVSRTTFAGEEAAYPTVNLSFLFDGCKNLERVDGLANLSGTRAMAYAFRGCAVTSIDLRGFDPSCLVDLGSTFSGRGSLHDDPRRPDVGAALERRQGLWDVRRLLCPRGRQRHRLVELERGLRVHEGRQGGAAGLPHGGIACGASDFR